jgi:small subunit ribosomal protein S16
MGRKKSPYYRVVVTGSTTPRNGQYMAAVGHYSPLSNPAELRLDLTKVDEWLAQGAEMSDTVRTLVNKARAGGDAKVKYMGASFAEAAAEAEASTGAAEA